MGWKSRLAAAIALVGVAAGDTPAGWPADIEAVLAGAKEIYVATQRKDGTRSSAAPVWFGVMDGAVWLHVRTSSYKARRTEKGRPVFVAATAEGPFTEARAEVVRDGAAADRLGEIYSGKYWIAWVGMYRPAAARIAAGETVLIKLTPK